MSPLIDADKSGTLLGEGGFAEHGGRPADAELCDQV
jgi:hypothetical protein